MSRRLKILGISVGVAMLVYVGVFAGLAAFGGYEVFPSGKSRPIIELATGDVWVWQPRYGYFHRYINAFGKEGVMADGMGYFFAPLILAQQRFFKPTRTMFFPNGPNEAGVYLCPVEEMHPETRALLEELR